MIQHINKHVPKERQLRIKGNKEDLLKRLWDFFGVPHEPRPTQLQGEDRETQNVLDEAWIIRKEENQRQEYEQWLRVDRGGAKAKEFGIREDWDMWSDIDCTCDRCKKLLQNPKLPRAETIPQAIAQVEDGIINEYIKHFYGEPCWKTLKCPIHNRRVSMIICFWVNHIVKAINNIQTNLYYIYIDT